MATAHRDPSDPQRIKERAIRDWVSQIMATPIILDAVVAGGQVEVRLFANNGEVRKEPIILLNAGTLTLG